MKKKETNMDYLYTNFSKFFLIAYHSIDIKLTLYFS